MKNYKRLFFLLLANIFIIPIMADKETYMTVEVGQTYKLQAEPETDSRYPQVQKAFDWIEPSSSAVSCRKMNGNYLWDVLEVTVNSYFSGTITCVAKYTVYDPQGAGSDPYHSPTGVTRRHTFRLTCSGNPEPGPGPDPGPDPDPSSDSYTRMKTIEGEDMWYCITTLYGERACIIMLPPFRPSSEACISQTVTGRITIPSKDSRNLPVRKIGSGAFCKIPGLTEVVIPSSL